MLYIINDLKSKVNCLKSDSSPKLISEIESILRSIRSHGAIPDYVKRELAGVLIELDRVYPHGGSDNIPHLVISIINQITGPQSKATAGSTAAGGQQTQKREISDPLSAFNILSKLNFRLWPWK